jgi:hypothetical protein
VLALEIPIPATTVKKILKNVCRRKAKVMQIVENHQEKKLRRLKREWRS